MTIEYGLPVGEYLARGLSLNEAIAYSVHDREPKTEWQEVSGRPMQIRR